jgi:predicted SPOUT superfamily RNA methylase MTH1
VDEEQEEGLANGDNVTGYAHKQPSNTVPAASLPHPPSEVSTSAPQLDEEAAPKLSFYQRTNPHKPSALPTLHGCSPRKYTISVAIPGSIILNAQSPELQARLAGQLARSCAIFNVDEIVVFNEGSEGEPQANTSRSFPQSAAPDDEDASGGGKFDPNAFLARILQYVETPQYLRKLLFPMHRDLRMAGILAPLDCPHHLRYEENSPYREGVCVEAPHWAHDRNLPWFYTGLKDPIQCTVKGKSGADAVPLGARVTIKMPAGGKRSE